MEYAVVGWPEDDPQLRLDHREFAYAGKFVMTNTGKATASEGDEVVAAVSFNADRTDESAAWLRYVTVRRDRRGERVGPRLAAFAASRLRQRGFETVRIAVNNPFAFHALYRAGFGFTGDETGMAELVLERPASAGGGGGDRGDGDSRAGPYRDGLGRFRERDDLADAEEEFVAEKAAAGPPAVVESPADADETD